MKFLLKARHTIKRYKLLKEQDRILVGVSGGPDSVALLYLLNSISKEFKLKLSVAHLDHMLRPDSGKDRKFVEALASRLKLPVIVKQIDVKKISAAGSLEESARNARFRFLFQAAKNIKADKIALGHNLDDQAETVLMRLLRGTGLYGLAGILPKRNINGFIVIRPLIETKRKDIEYFLRRRKIKFMIDKTNLQNLYFRNKIRHDLLPLLEKKYNKNIKEILSNMAEHVGFDYEYLNRQAQKLLRKLGRRINIDKFVRLHPSMQRLVLRLYIARLQGDMRRITFKHIQEIEDLLFNRPFNSIVDLPKGVSVKKKKRTLSVYRRA